MSSFVIYYRIKNGNVEIIGFLPFKMEDSKMWHGYQNSPVKHYACQYKYKKCEMEDS